ncbi:MAG: CoB--CoM heterodisulfide reductase iron-sulfur subunit B family protein [Verrucomicrobiae bacterium]|nr:CoB--CoM heterodisulfide reductase iron-sulfur subunit B family protein [Verrucomicrobiae bacterium]
MKRFAYFPGCSLEKMAQSYHLSTIETARVLGIELKELDDWNCCGATAYFHVDDLLAHTLCARNLAMAEADGLDVVAPCSGCYKNMHACNAHLKKDRDLADHINFALEEDNLRYTGSIKVHHLIEVFGNDLKELKSKVVNPLKDLRVAPYYGCQILRPRKAEHEDYERPRFFEDLMAAIGATPVDYQFKLRCCGAALIITNRVAALSMVRALLQSALDAGADVIATACPLCQVNLECYQDQVNAQFGTKFSVPVFYFTQLMGLALGIPAKQLGIGTEFVNPPPAMLAACKARAA